MGLVQPGMRRVADWQPTRRAVLLTPLLAAVSRAAPIQDRWTGVGRVVAVGDVHGDCDALVAVLKMASLVDDKADWIGGKTHLVQVGDLPARGPQTREAMDLLMKLEQQSVAAGGRVHALIGNHEAMVMYGDYRAILPAEYAEFRTADSEQTLQAAYEKDVEELKQLHRFPEKPEEIEHFKKDWFEFRVPGFAEYKEAFKPEGKYGSWIRSHNVVIRINDMMFLHGGISPKFLRLTTEVMNDKIRTELGDPSKLPPGMTTNVEGPLWYRGLAELDEQEIGPHLRAVLQTFGVHRVIVGHTVTKSVIKPRFGSKVVVVDYGLSRFYGRPPQCLVVENGSAFVLFRGTKIPLPGPTKADLLAYYTAAAAADVQPSPIQRLIDEVKAAPPAPRAASSR
jgi:hypothetical protein